MVSWKNIGNYLVDLHGKGKVKFVARTDYNVDNEATQGFAIYVADTAEEAKAMMMGDPCLVNNVMEGELHPLLLFMLGNELLVH